MSWFVRMLDCWNSQMSWRYLNLISLSNISSSTKTIQTFLNTLQLFLFFLLTLLFCAGRKKINIHFYLCFSGSFKQVTCKKRAHYSQNDTKLIKQTKLIRRFFYANQFQNSLANETSELIIVKIINIWLIQISPD